MRPKPIPPVVRFEGLPGEFSQHDFGHVAALEAADRVQPEVVLLDRGLAQMDGYEVARRLQRTTNAGAPS